MTGGCAFLDYDADGLLDIFLVNGAALREEADDQPRVDKSKAQYWNRLYRNVGKGRFEDVTAKARVQGKGYGLGVAVGDYDNDGYPDLYVTNYGRNELYHNEGDGTFREVTDKVRVSGGSFFLECCFPRLRQGRRPGPLCREVRGLVVQQQHPLRDIDDEGLLPPQALQGSPRSPIPQQRRWNVLGCLVGAGRGPSLR